MGNFLSNIFKKRADSLVVKGKKKSAIKWYSLCRAYENVGDIHNEIGNYSSAIKCFLKSGNYFKAGQSALNNKEYKLASEYFLMNNNTDEAAKALLEGNDKVGAIEIYLNNQMKKQAAQIYENLGNLEQAASLYSDVNEFDKAIELYKGLRKLDDVVYVYKKMGNLTRSAEECKEKGELIIAARLYEGMDNYNKAAEIYESMGRLDRAFELYEVASNYGKIGEIYEKKGKLHLAAEMYEKDSKTQLNAAQIYNKLIILKEIESYDINSNVICGVMAKEVDCIALGLMSKEVVYTSKTFVPKWRFKISGEGHPISIAITSDGKFIGVGTDDHMFYLLNNEKQSLWEKKFDAPVKDVAFLPDNSGVIITVSDVIVCLSREGGTKWENRVDFKAWSIDLSKNDSICIVGSLGGGLFIYELNGELREKIQLQERVYKVRLSPDDKYIISAIGDNKLTLFNMNFDKIWEYLHKGIYRFIGFVPGMNMVVAAEDNSVSLLDNEGNCDFMRDFSNKIITGFMNNQEEKIYLSFNNRTILGFIKADCKMKAAECFVRARALKEAAEIYRNIQEYQKAYDLYKEIGDYENAAYTMQLTGDIITAARHFEVVGRYDKAADLYEQIGELSMAAKCYGKANNFVKAGELYEKLGDIIIAADFFERVKNYKKAGILYNKVNQTEQAISNLEKYFAEHSEDKDILFELGRLYMYKDKVDDAIKMFQQLIDDEQYKRESLKNLGECFLQKKLYDVAIDRYFECLGDEKKVNRSNLDIHYGLGCTYEFAGRYQEAKDTFNKILAIDFYYKDVQDRLKRVEEFSEIYSDVSAGPNRTMRMDSSKQLRELTIQTRRRYQIIRKLGEGGMGVVYLAIDQRLNRQVAWKVLPSHLASNKEFQQRLVREARATAQLNNPHIIAIYDFGTEQNECYISMEYIDGITLRKILADEKQLPMKKTLVYGIQIAEGLYAAHKAGIIHRDVKPENIMITTEDEKIKMMDFGLARLGDDVQLTREGCVVGSVRYMAPEQIKALELDQRTDIYAFGVILFEMLAGRTPFVGDNILAQHIHKDPPSVTEFRTDVYDDLNELILNCLKKKKEERPENCNDIFKILKDVYSRLTTSQPM